MSWSHEKICQALPAYSHSSVGEPGNEAIEQAYTVIVSYAVISSESRESYMDPGVFKHQFQRYTYCQ